MSALTITEDMVKGAVRELVREQLTPEMLREAALEAVDVQLIEDSLVLRLLKAKTVRQAEDACRKYGIPVRRLGNKRKYVELSKIKAAVLGKGVVVAAGPSTSVERVEVAAA